MKTKLPFKIQYITDSHTFINKKTATQNVFGVLLIAQTQTPNYPITQSWMHFKDYVSLTIQDKLIHQNELVHNYNVITLARSSKVIHMILAP